LVKGYAIDLELMSLPAKHVLIQVSIPNPRHPSNLYPRPSLSPAVSASVSQHPICLNPGSITAAVAAALSVAGFSLRVEVECQSLEEAREAIAAGADVVMLDNLEGEALLGAAKTLKDEWREGSLKSKGGKGFLIESSGGVEEGNLKGRLSNGQFASLKDSLLFGQEGWEGNRA
jgi:hypothetical protein